MTMGFSKDKIKISDSRLIPKYKLSLLLEMKISQVANFLLKVFYLHDDFGD